ncbi:MAG: hypothetical protein HFI37_03250 [Lachnospiraceae bacterium]|nr:hypothetical protein [Lachnospiraceae bacterium]
MCRGIAIKILKIREHSEIADKAEKWFHSKWKIPIEAYKESIDECLKKEKSVPQWYTAIENNDIIGGIGVIENDFHDREDLAPNVCALYVEKSIAVKVWREDGF